MPALSQADLNELASYCETQAVRARNNADQAIEKQLSESFLAQADNFFRYAAGLRELAQDFEKCKRVKGQARKTAAKLISVT